MKTSEQVYNENQDLNYGDTVFNSPEPWQIKAMKDYARLVAEQTLNRAYGKSKIKEQSDVNSSKITFHDVYETTYSILTIDISSIIDTEIITP